MLLLLLLLLLLVLGCIMTLLYLVHRRSHFSILLILDAATTAHASAPALLLLWTRFLLPKRTVRPGHACGQRLAVRVRHVFDIQDDVNGTRILRFVAAAVSTCS